LSDLLGKVDRKSRKPWITQEINKIEELRRRKKVNNFKGRKNYRSLRDELKRATEEAKNEYTDGMCDGIVAFQRTERHDLMYVYEDEGTGWERTPWDAEHWHRHL